MADATKAAHREFQKESFEAGGLAFMRTGPDDISAPAVLFIHGNSSCKEVFKRQFSSDLADRYRLYALDMPGHGASPDAADPDRDYLAPALVERMIDAAKAAGLNRTTIVGYSMGGHLGLQMASQWQGIERVMIVGTPPLDPTPEGFAAAFRPGPSTALMSQEEFNDEEIATFAAMGVGEANVEPYLIDATRRADGRMRSRLISGTLEGHYCVKEVDFVRQMTIPLAVLVGEHDGAVDLAYAQRLDYATLWGDEVQVMAGCGHAPFLDNPGEFNRLLDRFVRGLGPA